MAVSPGISRRKKIAPRQLGRHLRQLGKPLRQLGKSLFSAHLFVFHGDALAGFTKLVDFPAFSPVLANSRNRRRRRKPAPPKGLRRPGAAAGSRPRCCANLGNMPPGATRRPATVCAAGAPAAARCANFRNQVFACNSNKIIIMCLWKLRKKLKNAPAVPPQRHCANLRNALAMASLPQRFVFSGVAAMFPPLSPFHGPVCPTAGGFAGATSKTPKLCPKIAVSVAPSRRRFAATPWRQRGSACGRVLFRVAAALAKLRRLRQRAF